MNKCVKYVVIDGCRLHFYNELPTAYNTPTGSLISSIDLIGLNFTQSATQIVFGSIVLDKSSLPPIIIGYSTTPVPFDLALIEAAIAMCGEPEPIIVDALNCDNTTTPTEVTQRVAIVAEQPIKVCIDGLTETVVYEKYCDIATGEVVAYAVLTATEDLPSVTTVQWFDPSFSLIAVQPANSKVCSVMDIETIGNCFQSVADPTIRYSATVLINTTVTPPISIGTIWTDGTGAIVPAPANIEPCAAATKIIDIENCDGTSTPKEVDSTVGAYILNQKFRNTTVFHDTAFETGTVEVDATATSNPSYAGALLSYGVAYTQAQANANALLSGGAWNIPAGVLGLTQAQWASFDVQIPVIPECAINKRIKVELDWSASGITSGAPNGAGDGDAYIVIAETNTSPVVYPANLLYGWDYLSATNTSNKFGTGEQPINPTATSVKLVLWAENANASGNPNTFPSAFSNLKVSLLYDIDECPICIDVLRIETECGITWTDIQGNTHTPIAPKQGACVVEVVPECKKEIFATHQRFYEVQGAPINAVAYEMTQDLPTQGLDVSNAYFHLIYPTLNGTTGAPIGAQLTEYFSNPQSGILWSDIAGVQAVIDFVLPSMGLSVGDVVYAINTSNLPIFFLSPTAVTELANGTFLHIYWGASATHQGYNEKADVTVLAANGNVLLGGANKCVGIQQVKEKDTCTGVETYRYIVEDGAGNLVDASTAIAGFDKSKVLFSCATPETFDIKEREVCITINGSVDSYEAIKVYKRSQTTGVSTLLHYETKAGVILTGTIVEVCCDCDSLCDVPIVSLNRICFAYGGSFNGDSQFPADKANFGADMFLEYFEVDGNVLVNTQTAIGNTGVATFSDVGYGIAYDNVVTLLNASILGGNDLEFVPAGNVRPDTGWGVKYNDAKSYRIVVSDFIPTSGVKGYWTIVINPTEQWDGLGDATNGNYWTFLDFQNNLGNTLNFVSCASL